jgi:Uma2 family endonuclease
MSTRAKTLVTLESGDRLTREEFHRRYCARPDIRKAELIQGVVYVASPTSGSHGEPHGVIVTWLGNYAIVTPGVRLSVEGTIFLSACSEVQPDAFLFRDPPPPDGARMTKNNYVEGAPQFVVEVAYSSASYDLHDKKEAYRAAGMAEYAVWRVRDTRFDWFRPQGDEYVLVRPDAHGIIESAAFPGLRLNVRALLDGDFRAALLIPEQQSDSAAVSG